MMYGYQSPGGAGGPGQGAPPPPPQSGGHPPPNIGGGGGQQQQQHYGSQQPPPANPPRGGAGFGGPPPPQQQMHRPPAPSQQMAGLTLGPARPQAPPTSGAMAPPTSNNMMMMGPPPPNPSYSTAPQKTGFQNSYAPMQQPPSAYRPPPTAGQAGGNFPMTSSLPPQQQPPPSSTHNAPPPMTMQTPGGLMQGSSAPPPSQQQMMMSQNASSMAGPPPPPPSSSSVAAQSGPSQPHAAGQGQLQPPPGSLAGQMMAPPPGSGQLPPAGQMAPSGQLPPAGQMTPSGQLPPAGQMAPSGQMLMRPPGQAGFAAGQPQPPMSGQMMMPPTSGQIMAPRQGLPPPGPAGGGGLPGQRHVTNLAGPLPPSSSGQLFPSRGAGQGAGMQATPTPGMMAPPPPGMQAPPTSGMAPPPPGMQTAPVQQQPPRQKIDPDHMPNPVAVMRADQDHWRSTPFLTSTRGTPPPLTATKFSVRDEGNCSPRFVRSTMYTAPCSKDLLNGCRVPLGLVTQPLADIPPAENTIHLVDHGSSGPIRCNRCKAYMNPFARFIDGGRQYYCPICQCSNEVPQEYFCHLDHNGRRTDTMQRPELCYGSVEFVATKDYCKDGRLPKPPAYIFMLDVSFPSVQSGLLNLFCENILALLDQLPGTSEETDSPIRVGFVTYDKSIQFYNVKASLAQPQMMVLTDVSEVFVPMVDGFLVEFSQARAVIENLVNQLPTVLSSSPPSPHVMLEPAVRAGMEALKAAACNGRLFVFHSSLPTAQVPGQLKSREDSKLLGTDKEKTLLSPASGSSYQKLAEDCVKHGVGVELFLVAGSYCDVATMAHFASTTGGELHLYRNLEIKGLVSNRDGGRLISDLRHSITRNTAFDAVMRVRASTGLRPTGFFGAFHMSTTTDIELGNIDCDKAVTVEIKHDDKLKEDDIAFFQCALLYTDWCGQRRLRVHNLALNCSTKYQDLYRSCEIDTITAFFSKSIAKASLSMSYKSIRESFIHQCAVILACYRKNCSQQSPPGQLILPENLKLLPMYANCLLKSDALLSPPIVSLDEKCWLLHSVLAMPSSQAGAFFYPRMYSLHDVDVEGKGLPAVMRCTGQKLQDNGVYLVENGFYAVMWVGQQASNDFVMQVFGDHSAAQVNTDMRTLLSFDNALSLRIRGILAEIQSSQRHTLKLVVTKQKDKSEVAFRRLLKEDKGAGPWEGSSYIDFLLQVHREIKEILS